MKYTILIIIFIQIIVGHIAAQSYDRHFNPNYMVTTFQEDFSGASLNRNVWVPTTHFKRGLGFLIDSTLTIRQEKGNLLLTMKRIPNYRDNVWKSTGWQPLYSNYVGAEVATRQKFLYGVFECRAKFAQKRGSWPAFWLIGGAEIPCPPGGPGNEIDIAELARESDHPKMMHNIHRYYPPKNCDVSILKNVDRKDYPIARREKYKTYKCIWTPQKIQYFINDQLKHEVVNKNYDWFPSFPLKLILSQQVLQAYDPYGEIKPKTPQTSYFDWVKVKEFFLAPEISCPQTVTSPTTATLNVDPKASNISWKLTPSSLFTNQEGKGKTANIVRAENVSGSGKITYTFQMPSGEVFNAEKEFR